MARAEATISEKADQLKSVATSIKAEIAEQEAILHKCAEKLRSGYEMKEHDSYVDYDVPGVVRFIDKDTGEVLEERPLTESEQLKLSGKITDGKIIDAEQVIREAREEEDGQEA
jgi:hypothetical protein